MDRRGQPGHPGVPDRWRHPENEDFAAQHQPRGCVDLNRRGNPARNTCVFGSRVPRRPTGSGRNRYATPDPSRSASASSILASTTCFCRRCWGSIWDRSSSRAADPPRSPIWDSGREGLSSPSKRRRVGPRYGFPETPGPVAVPCRLTGRILGADRARLDNKSLLIAGHCNHPTSPRLPGSQPGNVVGQVPAKAEPSCRSRRREEDGSDRHQDHQPSYRETWAWPPHRSVLPGASGFLITPAGIHGPRRSTCRAVPPHGS